MAARKKARIRTVGIAVRPDSPAIAQRARRLAAWLADRNVEVLGDGPWAGTNGRGKRAVALEHVERTAMMRKADLVVVLGGDGSLLGMARLSQNGAAPVVGLHHGDFGFLTESERGGPNSIIAKILDGDYEVEQRTMLAVEVKRNSHVVARAQALNDAVVARGTLSRMVTLEASVDGEYLATYKGDGLVIATPTGSTAYSLSAGGPVVEPNMSAILLTPISPHTLSSRPLVLSDRSSVAVRVVPGSDDVMLSIDGQESIELESDDVVEATKSRHRASIVKASGESFFGILRRKLSWGVRGEALGRAGRRRRE